MPRQIINILFILLICFCIVRAQTVIPAKSDVSGVWTVSGSPYIVEGEATIPQDSVLSIEAGVEVRFKTGTNYDYLSPTFDLGFLRIKGQLIADGSVAAPIVFTRNGSAGHWGILFFDAAPDSVSALKYCRIEHASKVFHATGWMEYSGALSVLETFLRIENCRITNNIADGLLCDNADSDIFNCRISDNGANGVLCSVNSCPQIVNCTISGNSDYAVNSGYNSFLSIYNSIFWDNGNSLSENVTSNPKVSHSLFQESALPAGVVNLGSNIFAVDPRFVDSAGQDYTLHSNSFCINSGNPDTSALVLPDLDLDGQPRIVHGRIDMGAFEFGADYLRLTAPNGFESWKIATTQQIRWLSNVADVRIEYSTDTGSTWSEIVSTSPNSGFYDWLIPADSSEQCLVRISDAANGLLSDLSDTTFIISDKTIISDGLQVYGNWRKEYSPFVIKGRAIVPADSLLTIEAGVEVRFATGINHDYQSPDFDLGILKVNGRLIAEGAQNDSIIFTRRGSSGNWGMIFLNQSSAESNSIKFARIEHASLCNNLLDSLDFSGALSVYSAGLTISDTRIENNIGSGIHSAGNTSAQILDNEISNNGEHGLLFSDSKNKPEPLVNNNIINGNISDGIFIDGAVYATIRQNRIESNGRYGVNNNNGFAQPKIVNNIISHNRDGLNVQGFVEIVGNLVSHNSRGIILDHIAPQIMNNTIVHNSDDGIFCDESSPYVTNCIFSGNGKDFDFQSGDASNPTASYSLFQKTYIDGKVTNGGWNRLGMNPGFVSSGVHPFSLKSNSPAIDAGTNDNSLVTLPDEDLAGKPRIYDGDSNGSSVIDIGSYEFSSLIADFTVDTTIGTPPFAVYFTDQSVGEIDQRLWRFGDGDSGNAENPQHTYQDYGGYTVSLSVSGPLGTVEKTEKNLIIVEHAPHVAAAPGDTSFYEDCGRRFVILFSSVFSDADSADTLRYSAESRNEAISVSIEADSLFLSPAQDFFGQGSVIITATDRYGLTAEDTFQVVIKPVNDTPLIASALPDSLHFLADSSAVFSVWEYVSDIESHDSTLAYSFSVTNDSLLYNFNDSAGILHLTAQQDFRGSAKLFINVTDDSAATARDSVTVLVESPVGLTGNRAGLQPLDFELKQNYPNPFNPETIIGYQVETRHCLVFTESSVHVELTVYNILGQKVRMLVNTRLKPGKYSALFNGSDLPSGVYYYRLKAGTFVQTKKMILMR